MKKSLLAPTFITTKKTLLTDITAASPPNKNLANYKIASGG